MPTVAFNICCLRALSSLRGLRGAPEVPPLCRETQSLGQQMSESTIVSEGFNVAGGLILALNQVSIVPMQQNFIFIII